MAYINAQDLMRFQDKIIDETEGNIAQLNSYCKSAEQMVEKFLNYSPESKSYSIDIKSDGGNLLELGAMPVTELTGVYIDGEESDLSLYTFHDARPYIRKKDFSNFQKGSIYTVTFTAGYSAEDFPEIIKTTALQIASLFWESSGGNLAVSSTSFADTGSRVFNNFTADRFLSQLRMYRIELV